MNAIKFLDFAKKIDLTDEASFRSCISRAYYCAYHACKLFIEVKLNINTEKLVGGSHERLSKVLIQEKNSKLKGLGYKLNSFHSRRVMADYILDTESSLQSAKESINECEKILKIISDYNEQEIIKAP